MTAVKYTYENATDKQIAYATNLAANAGYSHLSYAIKDCFGKNPIGGIKRGQVSTLIEWLKAR
jgi:hypothetical protein